jgi:hypothetical protein
MADSTIEKHLKRIKLGLKASKHQREREVDDLAFQVPDKQWPDDVKAARSATTVGGVPIPARPMLSVAPVDEPIQLVSNQQRAAHLSATFHPLSEDADDDTALVLQGLYDQGANESNADQARSWAYERVLWCGTGWYRLVTVYDPEGGHPSDQKIIWQRIKYQGAVIDDPLAKAADKRDRRWLYLVEDIPASQYADRYPESELANCDDGDLIAIGIAQPEWVRDDADTGEKIIRVAEAWEVRVTTTTLHLHSDNNAYGDDDEVPDGVTKITGDSARTYPRETRQVFWSTINCQEELEPEQEWDGQWIPFIPAIGRELQPFDGKERIVGMIANAKDSVRLVNYSASGAVEMAALEPKAPWILDPKQIEGGDSWDKIWQQSNTRNFPYLPYHAAIDGQPVNPPSRVQVDVSRLGPNMQILSMGGSMLQSSMSTFDPALGKQPTAHRSGRALEALQGQTQEANSHYLDNLATISIPYEALVWLDLAPKVYDRPGRVVRILKGEGPKPKSDLIMLGQPFARHPKSGRPQAILDGTGQPIDPDNMPQGALHFDLSKGRYGVSVQVGKSHPALLQEGNDALTAVIQAEPALMQIIGPEWAKFQDRPGMKAVADILKRNRDHQMPWLSDQGTQNLQAENAQMKAQLQQVTQAAQQMKQQIDTDSVKYQMQHQTEVAVKDLESKTQIQLQQMKDATQIEVARINAAKEGMIAEREAAEERLATGLKMQADAAAQALEHGHVANQAELDRQHELRTTGLEHGADVAGSLQDHAQNLAVAEQGNQHALEQADAQRQAAEAAQPDDSPQNAS